MEENHSLKDPSLALEPTDVRNNFVDVLFTQTFNPWHVPKLPVMGLYTLLDCTIKSKITVVVGLINL
jgi:hypothetical protein